MPAAQLRWACAARRRFLPQTAPAAAPVFVAVESGHGWAVERVASLVAGPHSMATSARVVASDLARLHPDFAYLTDREPGALGVEVVQPSVDLAAVLLAEALAGGLPVFAGVTPPLLDRFPAEEMARLAAEGHYAVGVVAACTDEGGGSCLQGLAGACQARGLACELYTLDLLRSLPAEPPPPVPSAQTGSGALPGATGSGGERARLEAMRDRIRKLAGG